MPPGLLAYAPPEPWELEALCNGHPRPELWFPERGADTTEARTICHACPVRRDCLDFALRYRIKYGMWGGRSSRQRDRMLRGRTAA